MHWGRRLQYAAVCAMVVAYAGLSHYCNTMGAHNPRIRGLGAALALAPLTLFALVLAWRRRPPAALLFTAALGVVLYVVWPLLEKNFSLFYLVQETSVYSLLCLTFGRSLLPGKVPLCTQLADKVHGPLSPLELRYTRRVTLAWTVFFFAVAAVSLLLFVRAPLRVWSIYINFCVLPLVGAMFVAEYLVRRRVLPKIERAGLIATVRVYFASSP
jgi:uncharacterized membrane protein